MTGLGQRGSAVPSSAIRTDQPSKAGSISSRVPPFLRRLAFGLRGRLLLAFIVISLFVVAAAVAGLYAVRQIGQTLDRITTQSLPVALEARELSRKSEKMVAAGGAVANAADAQQVDAISSEAVSEVVDALTIHEQLTAAELDPNALFQIAGVLTDFSQNIELLRSARLAAIAADGSKVRVINSTLAAYQQFEAIWRPRFDDLRSKVLGLQRTMTSPESSTEQRRRALDQFEQAMVDLLSLDAIRREAGVAFELIMRAGSASTGGDLDALQTQAQRSIRSIDGLVSNIDPDISLKLLEALRDLRAAVIGDRSIFTAVGKEITAKNDIGDLIEQNTALATRLTGTVDALVAASRREMNEAEIKARQVQTLGRQVLFAVTGLSLGSSLLIVWLYVGRNIVARLVRLGGAMIEIAGGGRATTVPTAGFDEIAAMGRAVEVFRRNAIELDNLLAERAQAADRLERQVEERTGELRNARDAAETALRKLQAAQANLVQAQKMAALGQLTAGIAHEIKNPLNFVNNFASLSTELLDELKEAMTPALASVGGDKREAIDETIETLTGNLEKIEEHGKRADNIVKSMLEHSRGVSGERREVDLNGVIEEALNLAYHGARAQDVAFNVTLEREFDRGLAPIELAPQEMTRVFLNLFGNGFYATTKRQREGAAPEFRPTLKVATRDLGHAVEVRVGDNGTGIPLEIRDKLFQPFATTKPTGEGTGLGLSIAWDIVTQQHGGTLEVDSRVGEFTEFTIRLPRAYGATIAEAAA